ncbi:MAG: PEP/pyruvate-binding domain-containing protein [Paracoccaceae bacterium]
MSALFLHPVDRDFAIHAGGKGAALARLALAGFEVPPFFVIPSYAFVEGTAAPGLGEALATALPALGPGPYAVRSSGQSEDGAAHSHAGQFDSLLNVPADGVIDAAERVWQSGFSDRIATYRALKDGQAAEPPAIVVQRMVPARAAGVAFSADPVAGLRGRAVISAIAGLGDALVSGEADGEDWQVDAGGPRCMAPATPPVLTAAEAEEIAALARKAEATFGTPQDVEWAYDGSRLYILQSRPITTPLRPGANSDPALVVLDNSNIIESYPGMVSPLTYSFARVVYGRVYRAFVGLLGVSERRIDENAAVFDNMLARVDGRIYYNLGNWYRALALLPGFSRNRAHMETMMGVDEPLPPELADALAPPAPRGLAGLTDRLRVVRVGLGLPLTRRGFYRRLDQALGGGVAPDRASLTQLAGEYRRMEALLLDRWDAPLVNDFLCMIAFGASRKLLERWAGPEGLAYHNAVMIGQGDIISAEPAKRIAHMGAMVARAGLAGLLESEGRKALPTAIEAEFAAYIAKFGDRCTQELKLESIPLTEDDSALVASVVAAARRAGAEPSPAPPGAEQTPAVLPATLASRPLRRRIALAVTGYARARVRDRENLRFERTRIFGHARRVFLAMGRELTALGVLDDPRDIFLLTVDEVLGAIEGSGLGGDLRKLADLRRAEADASSQHPDPAERLTFRGSVLNAATGLANVPKPPEGDSQQGTGCSAGIVTTVARVIIDPRAESLAPGEILVARNTDPGWIAVFANASAIVVERGSLLSHSAIVARELGIPCVVGIRHATQWIESGQVITVDGTSGMVRKTNG